MHSMFVRSGGNLVFKGSQFVPDSRALLGLSFLCWNEGISQNMVASPPPPNLGDFEPDGIRLRNTVRPRRVLSDALGRPHRNVDLGLAFAF